MFALMYSAVLARKSIMLSGHNIYITAIAWMGYISIGVVSMLFCAAVIKLLVSTTGYLVVKSSPKFSPSRRAFLSKTVGTTLSVAVLPMSGYGVYQAVSTPNVKSIDVTKPDLHKGLDGLRIVQLTDIHVGPTIGAEYVQRVVDVVNPLMPDLVLITGDLVDGSARFISEYIKPLEGLRSTYGTFFVTGNHEYYSGAKAWIDMVRSLGITVLNNSNKIIYHNEASLMVAGVPDIHAEKFGFEAFNPAKAKITDELYDFSIIMSHRPEVAEQIAKQGYDLQLSGHTHGGQFFPWTMAIYLFHKYVKGLYRIEDMQLYVSQGTAYWGPPLRLGAESEITEITLRS